MSPAQLSPRAKRIERSSDSDSSNSLQDYALQTMARAVEDKGHHPSNYSLFAVRHHDGAGAEILGPKRIPVGTYSEETLYGAVTSRVPHFRSAIRALATKAHRIAALDQDEVEYSYQVTLFWTDVVKLKEFLGTTSAISELVSEFLTARFQFLGKDTHHQAMTAIASALTIASEAPRLDPGVVERVVDALEAGGLDPLAVDALRLPHA